MDAHSPVLAKRLWNFLRIAFFMMRKGLISKRKLIMDMNLMMKRGKLMGKSLGNLMFHHSHRSVSRGFGPQDYEFSCSNSPNPVFFHVSKRKHHYFPCINPPEAEESDEPKAIALPKIEYPSGYSVEDSPLFAFGEKISPLVSPFSVRALDYSSEEENDCNGKLVDARAEEFIAKFYAQLKLQSRMGLLNG